MRTVAVTGGIGSGKSTVARMLAGLGAVVIDSDVLARAVVAPGTAGLAAVAREFGGGVIAPDGSLDRAALAAIVFAPGAEALRRRLEELTHPLVRAEFRRLRDAAAAADPDAIVVNDIPLVRTRAEADAFDVVVVVAAPLELRVVRLVARGVTEADARARIAAQIGDDERAALADVVIANDGDERQLAARVEALWHEILSA